LSLRSKEFNNLFDAENKKIEQNLPSFLRVKKDFVQPEERLKTAITSFNDQIQTIRAGATTMTAAGGDQFRPAKPGESSIFSIGGEKVIPLLEKIVNNTQLTPFPAK